MPGELGTEIGGRKVGLERSPFPLFGSLSLFLLYCAEEVWG